MLTSSSVQPFVNRLTTDGPSRPEDNKIIDRLTVRQIIQSVRLTINLFLLVFYILMSNNILLVFYQPTSDIFELVVYAGYPCDGFLQIYSSLCPGLL